MLGLMEGIRRWALPLSVIAATIAIQFYVMRWLAGRPAFSGSPGRLKLLRAFTYFAAVWMAAVVPFLLEDEGRTISAKLLGYLLAASLFWFAVVVSAGLYVWSKQAVVFDPARRGFLSLGAPVLAAAPIVGAGFGIIVARSGLRTSETNLRIKGLPKDLDGLRLAQLTDIHFGPFFDRRDLERAVAMANETKPHVALFTGDFITRGGDDLDGCLEVLRGVKADSGIYGCLGNHEIYAGAQERATAIGRRFGFDILRAQARRLQFGSAGLNIVGYDYQRMGKPYLPGAGNLVHPDAFNLLLSHNPDVFPRAAEAGFQATISGHTHGGQVNVEILNENLNVARFFTPYVRGVYEKPGSVIFVSSGLGTVGAPVRIGAPPEVNLIKLCAV
jgi:uncharacterized protein